MKTVARSLVALALSAPSAAMAAPWAHPFSMANGILHLNFDLANGATVTWHTDDLTPGADTVMHIWDPATGAEVAWNDDFNGGLNSRIIFTNTSGATRNYHLYVRAWGNNAQGTGNLYKDGAPYESDIPVGGNQYAVIRPPIRTSSGQSSDRGRPDRTSGHAFVDTWSAR